MDAITRKTFLASVTCSSPSLWLEGCGGGGGYGSPAPPPPGAPVRGAPAQSISDNHGHMLVIARADLDAASDRSYVLGASVEGHVQSVSFSVAQLAAMKAGASVTVTSTTTVAGAAYGGTHGHAVTAAVDFAACP